MQNEALLNFGYKDNVNRSLINKVALNYNII